jgi:hypothetical protein
MLRVIAGILVLGLGTGFYLLCRAHPPPLLQSLATLHQCHTGWLGIEWLGGMPTFSHVLGFALICTGLTCNAWQGLWGLVWAGTDIGAELWSALVNSLGTFDPLDICTAALAAVLTIVSEYGVRL